MSDTDEYSTYDAHNEEEEGESAETSTTSALKRRQSDTDPKIKALVPLTQANVYMTFNANITIDKKTIKEGAIALSEHLIIFAKSGWGSKYNLLEQHHLFNIRNINVASRHQIELTFGTETRIIDSENSADILRFSRLLIRNYITITRIWPTSLTAKFTAKNMSDFPRFSPHISLSQQFQLTYNAYCSYFDVDYYHDIPNFFHKLIKEGNSMADFSMLPLSTIDTNFEDPVSLRSVIATMMFCPFIYGYLIKDVSRPDFLKCIAPMIAVNKKIKILQLSGCSIRDGITNFVKAMIKNKELEILFYDLSNNPIEGISKLAFGLSKISNRILYLNLSNTGMRQSDALTLMKAFTSNPRLMSIRYLYIRGAPMNQHAIKEFNTFLELSAKHNRASLSHLDIGSIYSNTADFFLVLRKNPQPLKYLSVSGSAFDKPARDALIRYLETATYLEELDISRIQFTVPQVIEFLEAINKNHLIDKMKINLSGNQEIGKKFKDFSAYFKDENKADKITGLCVNNCGITAKVLLANEDFFEPFTKLTYLDFGSNLHKSDKLLANAIEIIAKIPTLQHLILKGNKNRYLGEKGVGAIYEQLKRNTTVIELDISDNNIGNGGIDYMADLLERNETIRVLNIDGSNPSDLVSITQLFSIVAAHHSLYQFKWPYNDVYKFIQDQGGKEKGMMLEQLSENQRRAGDQMRKNLIKSGYHSELSLLDIPEVNEILDEATLRFHEYVSAQQICQHSDISKLFGCYYAHIPLNQKWAGEKIVFEKQPDVYEAEDNDTGHEIKIDMAESAQIIALKNRRPDKTNEIEKLVNKIKVVEAQHAMKSVKALESKREEMKSVNGLQQKSTDQMGMVNNEEESSDSYRSSSTSSSTSSRDISQPPSNVVPSKFVKQSPAPAIQAMHHEQMDSLPNIPPPTYPPPTEEVKSFAPPPAADDTNAPTPTAGKRMRYSTSSSTYYSDYSDTSSDDGKKNFNSLDLPSEMRPGNRNSVPVDSLALPENQSKRALPPIDNIKPPQSNEPATLVTGLPPPPPQVGGSPSRPAPLPVFVPPPSPPQGSPNRPLPLPPMPNGEHHVSLPPPPSVGPPSAPPSSNGIPTNPLSPPNSPSGGLRPPQSTGLPPPFPGAGLPGRPIPVPPASGGIPGFPQAPIPPPLMINPPIPPPIAPNIPPPLGEFNSGALPPPIAPPGLPLYSIPQPNNNA